MALNEYSKVALIFWLICQNASALQSFDHQPQYQEVNPGSPVLLSCRIFQKSPNSICIWQKDGKPIRLEDGKYEWAGRHANGDCSLRIFDADINYDDGDWRCQVTPSSFDSNDALSSRPAKLVVRIPPSDPRIFHKGTPLNQEASLSVNSELSSQIRCESRSGNPAPILKWFIEDVEIFGADQKNETDIGNSKRWNAFSVIEMRFKQEHNGKKLKCVALHEAFSRKSREIEVEMNILYAPTIELERNEGLYDLEADVDKVEIECRAEANPKAEIVWRKAGSLQTRFRRGSKLIFDPVRQGDGGTYLCSASNEIGTSNELSITFDVNYEPRNLRTAPTRFIEFSLGTRAKVECFAEGNPRPEFEWLQRPNGQDEIISRSNSRIADFANVSYKDEGMWMCQAKNKIKGKERLIQSDTLRIDVTGKPEVLNYKSTSIQPFNINSNADLEVTFCSDPRPRNVHWTWGNDVRLDQGEIKGRFRSFAIEETQSADCFLARLQIEKVTSSDSRIYKVVVENDRGEIEFPVKLEVVDPVAMSTVIGISAAGLIILVSLVAFLAFSMRNKRKSKSTACCGRKKDSDSQTSFYPYSNSSHNYPPEQRTYSRAPTYRPERQGSHHGIENSSDYSIRSDLHNVGIPSRHSHVPTPLPHPNSGIASLDEPDAIYRSNSNNINGTNNNNNNNVSKPKPQYPLPPASQFPLSGSATFKQSPRKTPQNLDHPDHGGGHNNLGGRERSIVYADVMFNPHHSGAAPKMTRTANATATDKLYPRNHADI